MWGPIRLATRHIKHYNVTFSDDLSRYGYVYLIKHNLEIYKKFKGFQNEVHNQLGKKIKVLRHDKGGKYLSIEFNNHLRACEI